MIVRILLCFIIIFTGNNYVCVAQRNNNTFTLTGRIIGRDTGELILSYTSANGKLINDTSKLSSGKFVFSGIIAEPTVAALKGNLQFPDHYNMYDPNFAVIFLEPSKMTADLIENDYAHVVITGSATQQENEVLQHQLAPAVNVLAPLENEFSKLANVYYSRKDTSEAVQLRMDKIRTQIDPLKKGINKTYQNFLVAHPDSYVSADILDNWIVYAKLGGDSAMMYYNMVSNKIKNSLQGKSALKKISSYTKANRAAEKGGIAGVGSQAPNFSLKDTNGNLKWLNSFKGKDYVLLDFWASWCGPCIESTPRIKELYKKYHAKGLEIIIVSLDYDRNRYLKAIKKEGLTTWAQTYAGYINTPKNFAKETYGVLEIPQLVLIDKTGKIIGRYDGLENNALGVTLKDQLKLIFP